MRRPVSLFCILVVGIGALTAATPQADPNAILSQFNKHYAGGRYPAALIEAQKLEAYVKAQGVLTPGTRMWHGGAPESTRRQGPSILGPSEIWLM